MNCAKSNTQNTSIFVKNNLEVSLHGVVWRLLYKGVQG